MTITATILLVVALVIASIDWWAVVTDRLGIEFIAKPLVMIALIGMALALETPDNIGRGVVISALGASLVGDVVLVTPDARFELGLGAFLVAHVLYVLSFADHVQLIPALIASAVVVVVGSFIMVPVMRAVNDHGRLLTIAVAAYMLALSATSVAAASTGIVVAALGGAAFFVSDGLLGWGRFVGPTPGGRLAVMVTYHLGQAGLVTWLVFL